MQQQKSFIDLSAYEKEITTEKGFFNFQNTSYFYKICNRDLCYREIIAYEIAEFLGVPSIYYELALISQDSNKRQGVISKDYREKNAIYITGYQILTDYYDEYLNQWTDNERKNNATYNNLEDIWNALNYRYRFLKDKRSILNEILNKIVKNIFLFDLFTMNSDRHFNNWEIKEDLKTDKINLNFIYDNEDIFLTLKDYYPNLTVSSKRYDNWYDLLREFLIVSDTLYIELVEEIYNKLTPSKLIKILYLTEKKHNTIIPLKTKINIISNYNSHYRKIGMILKEFTSQKIKKILILNRKDD